jgi:hypothetical protein
VIITNLCFMPKPCLGIQYQNMIQNGGFEQNAVPSSWTIWNSGNIQANSIPGWVPTPEI